jgi:hypothetical protein
MKLFKNNPFMQRKVAKVKDPTTKLEKMIKRMPLKRMCRMLVNLPCPNGMDKKVILYDGLRKDLTDDKAYGKYKTVEEALAYYRKEPDFEWMLRKLGATWAQVEAIVGDVFNA